MTNSLNDQSTPCPESKNTPGVPNETIEKDEKWGFDMYPERRGATLKRSWFSTVIGKTGKEGITKLKCEQTVFNCSQESMYAFFFNDDN